MATHSSVLAWRIPGTGEPGGLPSMGSHRVRLDWSDLAAASRWPAHTWTRAPQGASRRGLRRSSWSSTRQHQQTEGGKGQWRLGKAGQGSETHQGAAPGIRGQDGRGTNEVLPRRPTWHRHGRGIEPTVEVGWPPANARGPEVILNDPEAKLLLPQDTESHRKKPPAQERSPGTQDVYWPSWPPWSPRIGACTHHRQHPEPQMAQESTFPPCTGASTALTCNLLCPASLLGDRGHFCARIHHQPWRPGKDTTWGKTG